MKLKKILAAVAAAAVAVSTMAVSAFAIDKGDYFDGTLYLVADDGKPQWAVDNNVDITTIYGVKMYCTFNGGEIADESAWIGGGIGANSNSTGWKQVEWGRSGKEIIADLENGTVTWQSSSPIFKSDEKYAQLWIQAWGGTVTFDKVEILDKDGNVIEGTPAAPVADEATDDTSAEAPAADEAAPADDASAEAPAPEADDDADVVDDADVDVDDADEDDVSATTEAPVVAETPAVTEAPVADTNTAAAATGNVAVASIVAVMAVAGTAAIVAKKRK